MGRILGLLALLNIAVLGAGLGLEQLRARPARLVDFNADKVKLLGQETPPAPAIAPEEPASQPPEPTQPAAAGKTLVSRCLDWKNFDGITLEEVEARIRQAGIAPDAYEIHLEKDLGWWVYLPPFPDAETARLAVENARRLGVKEIAPVRGGPMVHAVSLGAFKDLNKARKHQEAMAQLGLKDVRMGPRPNAGKGRLIVADHAADAAVAILGSDWDGRRMPVACPEE